MRVSLRGKIRTDGLEMSLQYTGLVAQVEKANKVIKDLTPLEGGVQDSEALEGWVRMQNGKVEMVTEELQRLQSKLTCGYLHLLKWSRS